MNDIGDFIFDNFGWVVVAFVVVALGGLSLAIVHDSKEQEELRKRYMTICVEDSMKADPYLERGDAVERCDVAWKVGLLKEEKSKDTTIIPVFIPR